MVARVTIYGLYVDGEDMPRYIGQTSDKKHRLAAHRQAIRFARAIYRNELPDLALEMKDLEIVDDKNKREREWYWIEHFARAGVNLANVSLGASGAKSKLSRFQLRATEQESNILKELAADLDLTMTEAIFDAVRFAYLHVDLIVAWNNTYKNDDDAGHREGQKD